MTITIGMMSGEVLTLTPIGEETPDGETIYEDDMDCGDLWVYNSNTEKLAPTDGETIEWDQSCDAWVM